MSDPQQQTTSIARYTPAALAGVLATGIVAFVFSIFGFSDRISTLSAKVDALQAGQVQRDSDIRRLGDQVWELRREILSLRKPAKPAEGQKPD